jgi:hypothetical protein
MDVSTRTLREVWYNSEKSFNDLQFNGSLKNKGVVE